MQFNIRGTSDHGSDILVIFSTSLQASRCHGNSTTAYQTIRCYYNTVCQTTATVRKHYASTCPRLGHDYYAGIGDEVRAIPRGKILCSPALLTSAESTVPACRLAAPG